MREILFRGKRVDNGEWVQGFYTELSIGISAIETVQNDYLVDPDTVGQFTGLCDKNGKKIFEGDILGGQCKIVTLRGEDTGKITDERHLVKWNDKECGFTAQKTFDSRYPKFYASREALGSLRICAEYHPILGNIHDTPELLNMEDTA